MSVDKTLNPDRTIQVFRRCTRG